jgi:hypothetical protein
MASVGVWKVVAEPVQDQTPAIYHVLAPNIPAAAVKALTLDSAHSDHALRTKVTIERLVLVDLSPSDLSMLV